MPPFFRVLTACTLSPKYLAVSSFVKEGGGGDGEKRGREKLYYVPFRDLSLKPSCNDERIKGAQPLWTLADTLIHIRYTGKGKVQIKKTLSLFLSQDIAGDNIRVACPEIIFIFFRCNSGVCQLCVPSLITRFSSILMLFVDRNFYFLLSSFVLKKESKGFYFIEVSFQFLSIVSK